MKGLERFRERLLPTDPGSVGSKGDAEQIQGTLLNHRWLGEHIEDGDIFVDGLNSVFDDCCQIADQSLKAVYLHPVAGLFGQSLKLGSRGALRGSDDGNAGGLCLRLVIVVEKERSQELANVPFHIVGQQAK